MTENYIIFTDLDGTLLDNNYSYREAIPALNEIKKRRIPLILCSSKTRAELEVYRKELKINDPIIPENGGAIFIPRNYFNFKIEGKVVSDYIVIELGTEYEKILSVLDEIKKRVNFRILNFGDMTPEEIARDCNLDIESAKLAKQREYDEAFRIEGTEEQINQVIKEIKSCNLNYTKGGRYFHIMGDNDKGNAVRILKELYLRRFPETKSIGLGDSENDIPMLRNVDIPVLIKKPSGGYAEFEHENLIRSKLVGPSGWNEVILDLILSH